jgi:hypothetical protein
MLVILFLVSGLFLGIVVAGVLQMHFVGNKTQ